MKKTLQISNGVALLITITINYLSVAGIFGGQTVKEISDKYHNYFTPAGYAFSIWGFIYLGLVGFVVYTGRGLFIANVYEASKDDEVTNMGWWFVVSCLANSFWIVAWTHDLMGISVILIFLLLFSLLKIITHTRMELDYHPFKKYLFIFWPFAIYAGWITVALIANIAVWLTKIGWNGWGMSPISWTIIMIVIACLINVLMILKRNLREFGLVGIWALIAIAVSNKNVVQPIEIVSYAVAAIIFLFILLSIYKARKGRSLGMM